MADLNQTLIEDSQKEEKQIKAPDIKENNDDCFPCEKCDRVFPKKQARALHLNKAHNIKTINYTPGIVRQNSKKHMEIRLSLRCTLCSFISKTKLSLKKHIEAHHKNKTDLEIPEIKKRQHNSYNCPECNSTFHTKYNLGKHLKDQHQGKTLSPERKFAKMNHDKVKSEDNKEVEKKKELENLQDLLVQTGKEKAEFSIRLSDCNLKVLNLEKTNEALTQENNYLKVENEKAVKNINDLDKEYISQVQDLKRTDAQREHEIIYLKAENEKCNRDIEKLESAYQEHVIDFKKSY